MEIICLDTNILIAHKRAKKSDKDKTFLYQLTLESYRFAVSTITVYELLRGDNTNEDLYWKAMFSNMTILPFDFNCAEQAARIYKDLKQKGQLIETEDLFSISKVKTPVFRRADFISSHKSMSIITDFGKVKKWIIDMVATRYLKLNTILFG